MIPVLVVLGGAGGACLRYVVDNLVRERHHGAFPLGTLAVNVLGCFIIGLLAGAWSVAGEPQLWAGLAIGLCGGLTTFSTFSLDSVRLARARERLLALVNVVLSVGLGYLALLLGLMLAG